MDRKKTEAAIEAVLFAMGEAVEVSQIAKAIEQDVPTTEKLLHHMMDRYREEDRGIPGNGLCCQGGEGYHGTHLYHRPAL